MAALFWLHEQVREQLVWSIIDGILVSIIHIKKASVEQYAIQKLLCRDDHASRVTRLPTHREATFREPPNADFGRRHCCCIAIVQQ